MSAADYRVVEPATSEGVRARIIAATTDGRKELVSLVVLGMHQVPKPAETAVRFLVEHFKREEEGFSVYGETVDGQAIKVTLSGDLAQPATAALVLNR